MPDIDKLVTTGSGTYNNPDDSIDTYIEKYIKARKKASQEISKYEQKLSEMNIRDIHNVEELFASMRAQEELKTRQDEIQFLEDYRKRCALNNITYNAEQEVKAYEALQKKKELDNKKRAEQEQKEIDKAILEKERSDAVDILKDKTASKEDKEKARDTLNKANFQDLKEGFSKSLKELGKTLMNGLDEAMTKYSSYQASINARVQGSGKTWQGFGGIGGIENTLTTAIGITPYIKTEELLNNVSSLVEKGIVYDLEQRAFLQTVKDDISTTFDAANSTLLRIIRIQQSDSTAARLGMEAYMTRFLNNMYQNTEYLNQAFDNVSTALLEATSQMNVNAGVELEYTVQKWLGSLNSVGLSDDTVNKIASAIGYLGSGDITSLNSNADMQNLIVMASSQAGLNYSDMLINGLDNSTTNTLLNSMVVYLQKIAESDNNVIKSQYADIFGVSLSDLRAIQNLSNTDLNTISKTALSYSGAISELSYQINQLPARLSTSELLANVWDNAVFSLGSNIASNPVTFALWKVANFIGDESGGINIPAISAFGTGIDLNATVDQLLRLGVVGASSIGMMGDIISGIGSSLVPSSMLSKLGITDGISVITRGSGVESRGSGLSTSKSSSLVGSGNTSIGSYTQQEASESAKAEAKSQESENESLQSIRDIRGYLINTFDFKVDAITGLIQRLIPAAAYAYNDTVMSTNSTLGNITNQLNIGTRVNVVADTTNNYYENSILLTETISNNVLSIYNLLLEVSNGGSLRVSIDNNAVGIFGMN